jgi:hypothetical protein
MAREIENLGELVALADIFRAPLVILVAKR